MTTLKGTKPAEIVCYMTTAGLILLGLAFAFHTDPPAAHAAVDAARSIISSTVSAATPAPTVAP